jgi:hypothetical protein
MLMWEIESAKRKLGMNMRAYIMTLLRIVRKTKAVSDMNVDK